MTAVERKVVHLCLKDDAGVETASEGAEPNRYVVVLPLTPAELEPTLLERWLDAVVATPGLTALATPPRRGASCSTTRSAAVALVDASGPGGRRRLGRRHARDPPRRRAAGRGR